MSKKPNLGVRLHPGITPPPIRSLLDRVDTRTYVREDGSSSSRVQLGPERSMARPGVRVEFAMHPWSTFPKCRVEYKNIMSGVSRGKYVAEPKLFRTDGYADGVNDSKLYLTFNSEADANEAVAAWNARPVTYFPGLCMCVAGDE